MAKQTIVLAADHAGFRLKALLSAEIQVLGHHILDLGTDGSESVDYPDFGHAAARAIVDGDCSLAVICCGTGAGMAMTANRHPGVRAAVCHDLMTARFAREHNDANVLALGQRIVEPEVAKECLRIFLSTSFEGGRHKNRVAKIELGDEKEPL